MLLAQSSKLFLRSIKLINLIFVFFLRLVATFSVKIVIVGLSSATLKNPTWVKIMMYIIFFFCIHTIERSYLYLSIIDFKIKEPLLPVKLGLQSKNLILEFFPELPKVQKSRARENWEDIDFKIKGKEHNDTNSQKLSIKGGFIKLLRR